MLHGSFESLGLLCAEKLQPHSSLVLVLIGILVLHLLQLRLLASGHRLRLLLGVLLLLLVFLLLLLRAATALLLSKCINLLSLCILSSSFSLSCLLLPLKLHLLQPHHLFLVLTHLDH